MQRAWNLLLSVTLPCVLAVSARGADKEVTLEGKIMCAKCELKLPGVRKCQTVIQVKEDDKEVTYFFLDRGNKESWHEEVCGGGKKEGKVTGVVSEKDGKKWIKPTKVVYAESAKETMAQPMWMKDYATALKCSRQQSKPLAIFVGCGKDGWRSVVRGGKLSKEVERMLSKDLVCLYVDADTPAGKHLAAALKVSDGMGLVLGDRSGEYIDYRHNGAMSEDEMDSCLSACCGMEMNGHNGHSMANGSMKGSSMNGASMGGGMQMQSGVCPCCRGR